MRERNKMIKKKKKKSNGHKHTKKMNFHDRKEWSVSSPFCRHCMLLCTRDVAIHAVATRRRCNLIKTYEHTHSIFQSTMRQRQLFPWDLCRQIWQVMKPGGKCDLAFHLWGSFLQHINEKEKKKVYVPWLLGRTEHVYTLFFTPKSLYLDPADRTICPPFFSRSYHLIGKIWRLYNVWNSCIFFSFLFVLFACLDSF